MGLIFLSIYYLLDRQIAVEADNPTPTTDKDRIILEYSTLNSEVQRRGDLLASHGRIFIAASFVLLGAAASVEKQFTREILIWFTLTVYSGFLFLSVIPTKMLDNIALARLRGIEQCSDPIFEVHSFMRREIRDEKKHPNFNFWVNIRRRMWAIFLAIIILFGSLIQMSAAFPPIT